MRAQAVRTRLIRAFYDKQIYFDQTLRAVRSLERKMSPNAGLRRFFIKPDSMLFNYKPTNAGA